MKHYEIPIISHESIILMIVLFVVVASVVIVRAMISDYGRRLMGHAGQRITLLDFIRRECFYIFLYVCFLFAVGHGTWICLHLGEIAG